MKENEFWIDQLNSYTHFDNSMRCADQMPWNIPLKTRDAPKWLLHNRMLLLFIYLFITQCPAHLFIKLLRSGNQISSKYSISVRISHLENKLYYNVRSNKQLRNSTQILNSQNVERQTNIIMIFLSSINHERKELIFKFIFSNLLCVIQL